MLSIISVRSFVIIPRKGVNHEEGDCRIEKAYKAIYGGGH
jgi:hypothetical protein